VVGEEHIVGRERLAIGPFHPVANVERIRQMVLRDRPVGSKRADDVLLWIHRGQSLVDKAVDVAGAIDCLEQRVEDAGGADKRLNRATTAGGLGDSRNRLAPDQRQNHHRNGGGDVPAT
jgi:hypothetical protein